MKQLLRAPTAAMAALVIAALAFLADPASAQAGLPTITNHTVWGTDGEAALLGGRVNPNGSDTHMTIQYGTTTDYSSLSETVTIAGTSGPIDRGIVIDGLTEGTTYHWRVILANDAGVIAGPDHTFLASPGAATLSNLTVWGTSGGSALLGGLVNPNGSDTHMTIQYGTTTNYSNLSQTVTIAGTSGPIDRGIIINGLTAGTTYHWRVILSNDGGVFAGPDRTFVAA